MDKILVYVMECNGITTRQIMNDLGLSQRNVSSRLTGLKYRGLVDNANCKWYYATSVIELDNNEIEITLHNGNVEIWAS